MKNFSEWSAGSDPYFLQRCVVAFDLDDTLTEHGVLPARVVQGLEDVQAQGWLTVLVTGRAAGWVDALIKLLPFDAVVGENGALLYFWPRRKAQRQEREEATKLYWTPQGYATAPPQGMRAQHEDAAKKILQQYPRARVASDQPYRLYDLAIDFAEEVSPPLSLNDAEGIQKLFTKLGATAKVSSIHVNGWWGSFSKADGLRELLTKHYHLDLQKNVIYSGDSPNDVPLFQAAGVSVGVANVKAFLQDPLFKAPHFVTRGESATGALEILQALAQMPRKQ